MAGAIDILEDFLTDESSLEELDPNFDYGQFSINQRTFRTINVDNFLKENENKATRRKTESDMKIVRAFLFSRFEVRDVEYIPPDVLNDHLCSFILGVTKKDGSDYEPTTLRGFISSVERYLKSRSSKMDLMRDIEFAKTREVLKAKQKQLKQMGFGSKPKTAAALQEDHLEAMYTSGTLGDKTPRALQHSMWLVCTSHFGMRTGKEIHSLRWGDVKLQLDSQSGSEFILLNTERQTKTRTGENPKDTRVLKPRAYAVPDDPQKCPVHLYKEFQMRRPEGTLEEDSPFFLSTGTGNQHCWFKKTPVGINKLYNIMNEMKADAGIENARITPYSARKRLIQTLSDEGVPPNQIIQVSGHRNVNSLNNYSAINNDQSRRISNIISGTTNITNKPSTVTSNNNETRQSVTVPAPTSALQTSGLLSHAQFYGNVTFNFTKETKTLSQVVSNVTNNQESPESERHMEMIRDISDMASE